jgi:hypothetical protein
MRLPLAPAGAAAAQAFLALWSPALLAQPSAPVTLSETRCDYLLPDGARGTAPGLRVLEATARAAPFKPGLPAGASIACGRSSVVPAPQDWKVLDAGHVLYIVEATGAENGRIGALEISTGQFRYRLIQGQLTPAEAEQVMERLNAFQLSVRK